NHQEADQRGGEGRRGTWPRAGPSNHGDSREAQHQPCDGSQYALLECDLQLRVLDTPSEMHIRHDKPAIEAALERPILEQVRLRVDERELRDLHARTE